MKSSSLVYFEGPWGEAETAQVEAAAERVEDREGSNLSQLWEAPWVAVAEPRRGGGLYFASRRGSTAVLRAESAEDLATRIRAFRDREPRSFV